MEILLKYFSDFTPHQFQQLKMLEETYKEWNEKINVISRKDIDSLYEKHVLHSLSIAAVAILNECNTCFSYKLSMSLREITLIFSFHSL